MSSLKTLFPHITPASNTSAIATISHISTKSASTITASPSLSFWQPPSQVKSQLDILDSLTSGASTSSGSFIRTAATVSSSDIDDLLNLSQSSSSSSPSSETWVRVDLTVDSSKIPHSVVVNKVWKIWKEIIEEPSTSLSK